MLDAKELASRIDASYPEILSWTRRGIIPSIKSSGKYFYNLDQVVLALHERGKPKAITAGAGPKGVVSCR